MCGLPLCLLPACGRHGFQPMPGIPSQGEPPQQRQTPARAVSSSTLLRILSAASSSSSSAVAWAAPVCGGRHTGPPPNTEHRGFRLPFPGEGGAGGVPFASAATLSSHFPKSSQSLLYHLVTQGRHVFPPSISFRDPPTQLARNWWSVHANAQIDSVANVHTNHVRR